MNNSKDSKCELKSVRTELSAEDKKRLDLHLLKTGQKQHWWIRQAILEKMERESNE